MKWVIALVFISSLAFLAGCTSAPLSPPENDKSDKSFAFVTDTSSQFVAIDQGEPAFIVFTGIPRNISDEDLGRIKRQIADRDTLTLLTWEQFLDAVVDYANNVILRDDYPDIETIEGLVCLVASPQGTGAPWGLTWNSGIALTFLDYQHARKTYKAYISNPSAYEPVRDSRGDPVHPLGHLPFGGCI